MLFKINPKYEIDRKIYPPGFVALVDEIKEEETVTAKTQKTKRYQVEIGRRGQIEITAWPYATIMIDGEELGIVPDTKGRCHRGPT